MRIWPLILATVVYVIGRNPAPLPCPLRSLPILPPLLPWLTS
jgi:hypothetical protein